MRVLICGSRNWPETGYHAGMILALLTGLESSCDEFYVIEGCARGADRVAHDWVFRDASHFPADWKKHGRAAGPIRNQRMLDEGKPDVVYAFNYGRQITPGTKDMTDRATKAGIPVFITFVATTPDAHSTEGRDEG